MVREGEEILLVENDSDVSLLIMRALRKNGLGNEVVIVQGARETLGYLLDPDGRAGSLPRLVLLDLHLPHTDNGLDVLGQLKSEGRTRGLQVVPLVSSEAEWGPWRIAAAGSPTCVCSRRRISTSSCERSGG